jgi:hypothetical protein
MRIFITVALFCTAASIIACGGDDDGGGVTTTPDVTVAPNPSATVAPSGSPAIEAGIAIEEPAADAQVTMPLQMSGRANVFEGALTIDALGNEAGPPLCTRHVQATSGTGTEGTWKGVLAFAPPSVAGPVTLRAYTTRTRDGAMENIVERTVTIAAITPPIVITTPACAAVVSGTVAVSGESIFFEMPLTLELRDAAGAVVSTQRVFADPQGVERGAEAAPWSATIDVSGISAGFYDVVVYNRNRQSSAVENEFAVQVSVR